MAKFLNTSATNYFLEELIKDARDRLILISPFLKLNDRVKELLSDKNRLKIDVRVVYGKNELQPAEMAWLQELTYIRTSYCRNLHAKCYLNEEFCIITSLNLYEFSQVNNNEMGVLIRRSEDVPPPRAKLEARKIDIEKYPGRRLVLRVNNMHASGGGAMSGPKFLNISGELWDGPSKVATFTFNKWTLAGITTCRAVDSLVDAAAYTIADWLRTPTIDAKL